MVSGLSSLTLMVTAIGWPALGKGSRIVDKKMFYPAEMMRLGVSDLYICNSAAGLEGLRLLAIRNLKLYSTVQRLLNFKLIMQGC